MKIVTVVIPVYNEQESLPLLQPRLRALATGRSDVSWEFLFVNDGSRDGSREILDGFAREDSSFQVIHFSRNFGHEAALAAGIEHARGDYIAIIDADLQDPPELLHDMLRKLENGFNVVSGVRKSREGESLFKLGTARVFYRLLNLLSGVPIPNDTGDFRMLDRKVHSALLGLKEYHRFVRGMIPWVGFKATAIPYDRSARHAGETKYPLVKMLTLAFDAIFSFSQIPLRLASYLGIFISVLGLGGLLFVFYRLILFDDYIPGVSAVFFVVCLIGGVQLLILGILGEYVGRTFEQSKNRPLYIADELKNVESPELSTYDGTEQQRYPQRQSGRSVPRQLGRNH
jgi:dolichol-phosphate mannosyltransferase